MNTPVEPPNPTASLSQLFAPSKEGENPYAKEIDRLSREVEDLKDKLGDVIFLATFVIVVIIDLFVLPPSQNWMAPLVIGLLQLAFLFVVARVCRVNDIIRLIDTALDGVDRWRGSKPPSSEI